MSLENKNTIIGELTDDTKAIPKKKSRIKNYIDRPLRRREKKEKNKIEKQYEKKYKKKYFRDKDKKPLKIKILIGLFLTLGVIVLFRYVLKIDMTLFFDTIKTLTILASLSLIMCALFLLVSDKTEGLPQADPITDYFIVQRGKISGRTKDTLQNKVNARFLMVTLLKLYKKEEIAIVNEKIIYGTMASNLSRDEVAFLNFLLDNQVKTLDDYVELVDNSKGLNLIAKFYENYKDAVIQMAYDKKYINQALNKARYVLRFGGLIHILIVLAMLAKGQGTLQLLLTYSGQALVLITLANLLYARSKGANKRLVELKKQKKILFSPKENMYLALIYNYMFKKENRVLRKIDQYHKEGKMTSKEYAKFSETFNGFNYMLNYLKLGYIK